jgi:hypothetical protein
MKKCSSCVNYTNVRAYTFRALCQIHDWGLSSDSSPKLLGCKDYKAKKYTKLDRVNNNKIDLED